MTTQAVSPAVDLLCQILGELKALNAWAKKQVAGVEVVKQRQADAVERLSPEMIDSFLVLWNRCCAPLPTVRGAGPNRRKRIAAALRLESNLARWEQAIMALAASPWHRGENPGQVQYGTIDFLLRAGNAEAWLEKGEEHQRKLVSQAPTTRKQVWCEHANCSDEALFGPQTKNPDMSEKALCGTHWEAIVGFAESAT